MKHRLRSSWPWFWSSHETKGFISFSLNTTLLTALGLLILEDWHTGFVSNSFDLDIVMTVMAVLGALSVIWAAVIPSNQPGTHWSWLLGLSLAAGLFTWYRLPALGAWGSIIALLTAVVIAALGALLTNHEESDEVQPQGDD